MSDTKISWAGKTWNPITGCSPISPGCANCYAARMAKRLAGRHGYPNDKPFAVTFHEDKLTAPLRWKKPRMVFVCSMGDLFHQDMKPKWHDAIFKVMEKAKRHTFLLLTKRPHHMKASVEAMQNYLGVLPNIWIGVTAENQEMADKRIPVLLSIPAAKRFISVEPMLEPVFFAHYGGADAKIDWVIAGGETGPGARPVNPDWVRSLRDQCVESGVPFHFKSWGSNIPMDQVDCKNGCLNPEKSCTGCTYIKDANRRVDGILWNGMPGVS